MRTNRLSGFYIILLTLLPLLSYAQIKLPHIFSDDMVIQRDKPIEIWGTTTKPKPFTVSFAGVNMTVKPQKDGNWSVEFPAMKAGGPYQMKFQTDTVFNLNNILIGDIWICSGQSNMEFSMKDVYNSAYELSKANNSNIRSFRVPKELSGVPHSDFSSGKWSVATSEDVANTSAVAYFFAKNIYESENVPIGIICTYWGGSPIESWTSLQSIGQHPDFSKQVEDFIALQKTDDSFNSQQKCYSELFYQWQKEIKETDPGYIEKWYLPNYNSAGWKILNAPGYWEYNGLPNYDGVVWLRKEINIPPFMAKKALLLNLGFLSNYDDTWFNGVKVGSVSYDGGRRIYKIPGTEVHEGENTIAIRLENTSGNGGFISLKESDLFIREMTGAQVLSIPLAGKWLYKPSMKLNDYPSKPKDKLGINTPSTLYNAMIAPLTKLSIKGFIWYQGESNSWRAYQYRSLFPLMINDWRKQFNQGDIPFLFVQLAGYSGITKDPIESTWAELREAQTMTLSLPQTGMAVAIDIGNPFDVHPTNKQEVGRRLALEAQRIVYGKPELKSSPLYKGSEFKGNKIIISFSNVENGLISTGEKLGGFAIADSTKKFRWADARIDKNNVVVWSDKIKKPVAVRYGWTGAPIESNDANLYNKEGLPVSPFRTDDWECFTRNNK